MTGGRKGPGGRKQWKTRQNSAAIGSMVQNQRKQAEEPGPTVVRGGARIFSYGKKKERTTADMLRVRNRAEARKDARKVKLQLPRDTAEARDVRKKFSKLLRDADRSRAETAAEVVDPATGKAREDSVEERVKRRGLNVVKNRIIGGGK